jgi:hypothetical protein
MPGKEATRATFLAAPSLASAVISKLSFVHALRIPMFRWNRPIEVRPGSDSRTDYLRLLPFVFRLGRDTESPSTEQEV